jgi:hypothetical protein
VGHREAAVRIPLTLLALIIALAPELSVIPFVIALFAEHRFQLIKETGESVDLQKMFD